ncbi:hypothetical protein H7Y40_00475 [Pedobacter sp.]|nr:hypothetical protein [Candidatus Saccharibacteria bacterium]
MPNEKQHRNFPPENAHNELGYTVPFEAPTSSLPEASTPVRKLRLVKGRRWHRDNDDIPVQPVEWLSPEDEKNRIAANARGAIAVRAVLAALPEEREQVIQPVDAERTMTTLNGAAAVRAALAASRNRGRNSGIVSYEAASAVVSDLREDQ